MDREPVAIPGDLSVERALDEYFLRYRWPWFPVVDAAHGFLGLVQRDRADEVPEIERAGSHVSDLVDHDIGLFVRDDTPLDSLLAQPEPAPPRGPDGGRRRRPPLRRDHHRAGRPRPQRRNDPRLRAEENPRRRAYDPYGYASSTARSAAGGCGWPPAWRCVGSAASKARLLSKIGLPSGRGGTAPSPPPWRLRRRTHEPFASGPMPRRRSYVWTRCLAQSLLGWAGCSVSSPLGRSPVHVTTPLPRKQRDAVRIHRSGTLNDTDKTLESGYPGHLCRPNRA